jgi:hypothetical protein
MLSYLYSFLVNSRLTIENIKIITEQIIAVGRIVALQVISGIIHSEIIISGTIAQKTEAIAINADITHPASLFFDINVTIPRIKITPEITAIAMFALWQCIYEPSSFFGHWKINAATSKNKAAIVITILLIFFIM